MLTPLSFAHLIFVIYNNHVSGLPPKRDGERIPACRQAGSRGSTSTRSQSSLARYKFTFLGEVNRAIPRERSESRKNRRIQPGKLLYDTTLSVFATIMSGRPGAGNHFQYAIIVASNSGSISLTGPTTRIGFCPAANTLRHGRFIVGFRLSAPVNFFIVISSMP